MRRSRSRGLPFPSASPLTALVDRLRGPERRFWGGVYQTSLAGQAAQCGQVGADCGQVVNNGFIVIHGLSVVCAHGVGVADMSTRSGASVGFCCICQGRFGSLLAIWSVAENRRQRVETTVSALVARGVAPAFSGADAEEKEGRSPAYL